MDSTKIFLVVASLIACAIVTYASPGEHGHLEHGHLEHGQLEHSHIGHAESYLESNLDTHQIGHGHHEHHYPHHHPKYNFKYGVEDKHTGDYKDQKEERDGDIVHGEYSLLQPDGRKRIVHYTASKHGGFNAHVSYSGHAIHPEIIHHHHHL